MSVRSNLSWLSLRCSWFTKVYWVGKHINIVMKPTNSPTQGQPNPRKMKSKVAIGPLLSTANIYFEGWDWFLWETDYKKPNPPKFSANSLILLSINNMTIAVLSKGRKITQRSASWIIAWCFTTKAYPEKTKCKMFFWFKFHRVGFLSEAPSVQNQRTPFFVHHIYYVRPSILSPS